MTTTNPFKKAERKRAWLKIGLAGPSGSGKTFSALKLAKGMENAEHANLRIAVIDTENGSASLYAKNEGMPEYDVLDLAPPFTVDAYQKAIDDAVKNKYDVLIIDSVSHVWSGEGGLLQEKELLDSRGGNSYTNWAKMTPKWNKFVSSILQSDIHLICTMRSKQDYVLEANDKGKQQPKKVGMAPVVREGFEYELSTVFDIDMAHQAMASKDRTNLFDGRIFKIDEKTGMEFMKWLNIGTPKIEVQTKTNSFVADLESLIKERLSAGWDKDKVKLAMTKSFGTDNPNKMTKTQFETLKGWVTTKTAKDFLGQFVTTPQDQNFEDFHG